MKISKHQLIEMNACKSGLNRFIEQTDNTEEPVEIASLIGGKNTSADLLWLAGEILSKEKIVRFDCDVALINIEKIKPYTDKYDLIVGSLNTPTARTASAAAAAARTAATAALAAYEAATAADTRTAARTAYDAATAARTATRTAYATRTTTLAADAVAYARTAGASQEQINELLVKLFKDC